MHSTSNDLEFIFILDDDDHLRRSISKLLEVHDYNVRAFGNPEELLERKPPTHPCCLLLDFQLGSRDGLQIQTLLMDKGWEIPIVFMSGVGTIPVSVQALKNGALDFLCKPFSEADLIQAVENALKISREKHARRALQNLAKSLVEQLSDRELEVLAHVLKGKLNKQIAESLVISERTVKAHRARIMQKTGANSVAELVPLVRTSGVKLPPAED